MSRYIDDTIRAGLKQAYLENFTTQPTRGAEWNVDEIDLLQSVWPQYQLRSRTKKEVLQIFTRHGWDEIKSKVKQMALRRDSVRFEPSYSEAKAIASAIDEHGTINIKVHTTETDLKNFQPRIIVRCNHQIPAMDRLLVKNTTKTIKDASKSPNRFRNRYHFLGYNLVIPLLTSIAPFMENEQKKHRAKLILDFFRSREGREKAPYTPEELLKIADIKLECASIASKRGARSYDRSIDRLKHIAQSKLDSF